MNKAAAGVSTTFSNEEIVKIMSKFETYQAYLSDKEDVQQMTGGADEKEALEASDGVKVEVKDLKPDEETIEMINEEEEKAEVPEEDKKENVEMVEICGAMIPANSVAGASQGSTRKVEPSLKD